MKKLVIKTLGVAFLLGPLGEACTVPVFRFALDRWPPDAYRLEAPGEWLESEEGKALRELLAATNTELEVVGPESANTPARLLMPGAEETVVWSGPLAEAAAPLLLSPAREEIARRILAGESMVWVMVTGGEEASDQDEAFHTRVKARLEYLDTVAAIPEQDPNDPDSQLGPGPELRVGFSLLRVDRDDPKEEILLKMLAGPESQLLENAEPFAGVVFGRGRVLGAWSAADLDDEGIDEVSLFLLGACSCRVKVQNPGWDLAMAVDWETRLMEAQMAADNKLDPVAIAAGDTPGAPDVQASAPVVPETVTFGEEAVGPDGTESKAMTLNILWVGAAVAVVGLLMGAFIAYRKSG